MHIMEGANTQQSGGEKKKDAILHFNTFASVNWATDTTALVKELILENRARLCLCCWQHTPVLALVNAEISP